MTRRIPPHIIEEAVGKVFTEERIYALLDMPPCAWCGDPATGRAAIDGVRYCHGDFDPTPTCYMLAQRGLA